MNKKPDPITDDDVTEFLNQAQFLYDSSLMNWISKKSEITLDERWNMKLRAGLPSREVISSFLTIIRPFIEYRERLHVGRVISYLIEKYGNSESLRKMQAFFDAKSGFPTIGVNGVDYDINQVIYLFMYGKYLHLDKEKQKVYREIESSFGDFAEDMAISQLQRYGGIILVVAGYIKTLNKKKNNVLN